MSCEFCDKIWSNKAEYKKQFDDEDDELPAIMMDDDDIPSLYIPISDWYYSDIYLTLNYCPKCGRKL